MLSPPRSQWTARFCFLISIGFSVFASADEGRTPELGSSEAGSQHERFFSDAVLPILQSHCFECHAEKQAKGGFRLDLRSRLMLGGEGGTVVDFDDPEESVLLQAVRYEGYEMPPRGRLADEQIAILERWVSLGAPYPPERIGDVEEQRPESPGARITDADREFWSFRPLARPELPKRSTAGDAWGQSIGDRDALWDHPIDRFISQRQIAAGVTPNGPADPGDQLRRLSYDLTGLPPTAEMIQAFSRDPSDLNYLRMVDSLLASPQYGERWARHWLDLVRWAETNSYERDSDKPEAWRYRQYVIESFNLDRPYDAFVAQQLAGDELYGDPDGMIATGFYRLGIWDDEPADPKQALFDELDDLVAVTSQTFLGLTVNCARCHEHKIDPITHADYYRFLAFFAGVNRYGARSKESVESFSLRPLVMDSDHQAAKEAIENHDRQVQRLRKRTNAFERDLKPRLLPVDQQEFFHEANRAAIARRYVGRGVSAERAETYAQDLADLRTLDQQRPQGIERALVVTERSEGPPQTHVLLRGNPHAEGEPVEPGFLEVLGGGDAIVSPPVSATAGRGPSSGRRSALARWIVDPSSQPLAARVMANRVWQHHFGRGIVRTPSDFGFAGAPPTHPELLDHLALALVDSGWHLKPLHRLIVTSAAYRRSSSDQPALATDPENDHFWRFDPRRLSAEEVRDSMLAACGQLDLRVGGRSVYPVLEAEVLAGQSRPGEGWESSSDADRARRSLYVFTKRSLAVPLLASFDAADTDFTCPVRFATTQPTQALGLMNSQFSGDVARWMVEDIQRKVGELFVGPLDSTGQGAASGAADRFIVEVFRRVTQRDPTAREMQSFQELLASLVRDHQQTPRAAAELSCRMAISLNEFIFLD